ncbi:MAG TPA: VWA domain-containing protein [Gallionellaceae bacterium]|nr:VWA domain-containing protein [Gallionellaceae bacterium]
MITLAQPAWLLLIPLLLTALWFFARSRSGQNDAGSSRMLLVHPDLSPLPDDKNSMPVSSHWHLALNGSALLLLIVALAQPQRIGELIPEKPEGREIVMLIDTSKTMSIDDFELNGQRVDRLAVLKGVVSHFVEARQGDRFGVIVFGSTAATMVPPSFDRDLVGGMIRQVQVGIAGDNTAIGDAVGLALKQLGERQALRPALILFSDNTENTAGDISPSEAVALARHMGVAIYTVQVGSDLFAEGRAPAANQSPVEPDMQQIAALTGGRYYRADNSGSLQQVVEDIGKLEQTISKPSTRRAVEEWYGALLLMAVCLFSVARLLRIHRMAA